MKALAAIALATVIPMQAAADVIPIRAEGPISSHGKDSRKNGHPWVQLYGVDSASGKIVWIFERRWEVNFAERVPEGLLVGSDDGTLALLDPDTGTTKWDSQIASRNTQINNFRGRFAGG